MTDRDRLIELLSGKSIDTYADVEYVADYLIENGVTVGSANNATTTWISVEDRLPDAKGEYMVVYHPCWWDDVKEEVCVGLDSFRGKTTWAKRKFQRVTHWMPLPQPPKEVE